MANRLKSGMIGISSRKDPIGVGFVISDHLAITCDHVVRSVKIEDPAQKFPFFFPFDHGSKNVLSGRIILQDPEADIAIIEISDPLPSGVTKLSIINQTELWGHKFRAFGFPRGYPDGVWADGELRDQNAAQLLQIIDVKNVGYSVCQGFSGGPVWDDNLTSVVGMITAVDKIQDHRSAFCVPAGMLLRVISKVIPLYKPNNDTSSNLELTVHSQAATNILNQVLTLFSESPVFPSECRLAKEKIDSLWSNHITAIFLILNKSTNLSKDLLVMRETLRASIDSIHIEISDLLERLDSFEGIALVDGAQTDKLRRNIRSQILDIKSHLPNIE